MKQPNLSLFYIYANWYYFTDKKIYKKIQQLINIMEASFTIYEHYQEWVEYGAEFLERGLTVVGSPDSECVRIPEGTAIVQKEEVKDLLRGDGQPIEINRFELNPFNQADIDNLHKLLNRANITT